MKSPSLKHFYDLSDWRFFDSNLSRAGRQHRLIVCLMSYRSCGKRRRIVKVNHQQSLGYLSLFAKPTDLSSLYLSQIGAHTGTNGAILPVLESLVASITISWKDSIREIL
jgi:hypothetical protein